MIKGLPRWWLSFWYEGDDCRPLTFPPGPNVLGWWVSGQDMQGRVSLCLLVQARSEREARDAVYSDWPEARGAEWRFCDEVAPDHVPSDRFMLTDWMHERMGEKR